jgi:hypothetical protein
VLVTADAVARDEEERMTKLTEKQTALLVQAAARDDGAVVWPQGASKAGTSRIAASLIGLKLLRTCKAKVGLPVWRKDENGEGLCLILTRAGRAAAERLKGDSNGSAATPAAEAAEQEDLGRRSISFRAGTKQALLVGMLSKEQGASLDDMIVATGWLPHTTRAALTGLRKRGLTIERAPIADGVGSIYRMAPTREVIR